MSTITIMTWNICWGLGAPQSTLDQFQRTVGYFHPPSTRKTISAIARDISSLKPDIVALQEIDNGSKRNKGFDQVAAISKETRLTHSHFAVEKNALNYFSDGNALLSKHAFETVEDHMLSYWTEKRNYIAADIAFGSETITVITTHLAAHRPNAKERLMQVKELSQIVMASPNPVIVIGDINCTTRSPEYKQLLSDTGLRPVLEQPTYPNFKPQYTFDAILVSPEFEIVSAQVPAFNESDHLSLVARLKLQG